MAERVDDARPRLDRVLNPTTVAIVGVSEQSVFGAGARRTINSSAEIFFVHPKYDEVFGRPTYPDLASIGRPVDAVFTVVSAASTVAVVEAAADCGAGGVITVAGGFAEAGREGQALQERMQRAAARGNLPVIGPNGVGLINVPRQLDLTMLTSFKRRVGGVSVITHSGALLEAMAASAWRAGGVGFNLMISAGNEAVTDVADYFEFLVDDPDTRVIALAIEKIRRPDVFFAAARRARAAGKPVLAIKFGRGERAQRMARSHTGTLTGDGWVYEIGFRQANIQLVRDVDDLVDRMQFFDQLPTRKWSQVRGLGVLTMTGGFAAMASDQAEHEHIDVPDVPRLDDWIGTVVPGATVANPLDATGFAATKQEIWHKVMAEYAAADEFDIYLWMNQFAEWDESERGKEVAEVYIAAAEAHHRPFIISTLSGPPGWWMDVYRERGVAVGNGLRGCFRGLKSMADFMRSRSSFVADPGDVTDLPRPDSMPIDVEEGHMLPFADTMRLLADAGIPVAPFHLVSGSGEATTPPFDGPYVVKLADVAHRTEHGAVRVGVDLADLGAAVAQMRELAAQHQLADTVAIQPMVAGTGEAFIGLRGSSELGPVVVFGLGGIFVEVLRQVAGRLAPIDHDDAIDLIAEFDHLGVLDGFRSAPAWDRQQLADILVAAGKLAAGGRSWIESIDINPLIVGPDGYVAVDGLCLLR